MGFEKNTGHLDNIVQTCKESSVLQPLEMGKDCSRKPERLARRQIDWRCLTTINLNGKAENSKVSKENGPITMSRNE